MCAFLFGHFLHSHIHTHIYKYTLPYNMLGICLGQVELGCKMTPVAGNFNASTKVYACDYVTLAESRCRG